MRVRYEAGLLAVSPSRTKGQKKQPLDDVERAEHTVFWGESVERGIERDADIVHFLSENRGDVAE